MASVDKFTAGAVRNQLRHNNREIQRDSNTDIDPSRTFLNYSLTPDRGIGEYEYYKKRLNELYTYNRADVKTMAGWIITLPKEITLMEEQKRFFQSTYDFLADRYGDKNVIQATIHYDEGKVKNIRNRFTGEVELDDSGKPITQLVYGQPHLHFCFIPATHIDHENLHKKKKYPKAMDNFTEKVSANDVLTKKELQHFHTDLQRHLDKCGIDCKVLTGKTKAQGRNYSVAELKENFKMQQELQRLREIERKYNLEHTRTVARKGRW